MADEPADVLDEVTKIRLRMLQQRMRSGAVPTPVRHQINSQQLLQAEMLRNQQLVQRLKEEQKHVQHYAGCRDDEGEVPCSSDMMTMMITQNMQLQQLMMQQMLRTIPLEKNPVNPKVYTRHSQHECSHPPDLPDASFREMTPFTTLPQRTPNPKVSRSVLDSSLQGKLSKHQVRGMATPVRPAGISRDGSVREQLPRSGGHQGTLLVEKSYPFPGTAKVRKLRHIGYVAWACFILLSHLKKAVQRQKDAMAHLGALISQTIDELHREHFTLPGSPVHTSLLEIVQGNLSDMNVKSRGVFHRISKEEQTAINFLSGVVEAVIEETMNIQGSNGLLGTTKQGILWQMLDEEVYFPPDYLWHEEKEFLEFTDGGAVIEVDDQAAAMLLLGLVISRGFVATLLLKPIQYGLTEEVPDQIASSNLRVLGTVLMKIVREVSVAPDELPMPLPIEISSQLFHEEEMKFLYKKLEPIINWGKANLRTWAMTYVESVRWS